MESAISQPPIAFNDQYAHETLHEMAAAYLFHICANHPFIDGNKRVALQAALVFLELNGYETLDSIDSQLIKLTLGVASGSILKPEVAKQLKKLTREKT